MYLVDLVRIAEKQGVGQSIQRTSIYMRYNTNGQWVMIRPNSLPLSEEMQELEVALSRLLASVT